MAAKDEILVDTLYLEGKMVWPLCEQVLSLMLIGLSLEVRNEQNLMHN